MHLRVCLADGTVVDLPNATSGELDLLTEGQGTVDFPGRGLASFRLVDVDSYIVEDMDVQEVVEDPAEASEAYSASSESYTIRRAAPGEPLSVMTVP